MKAQDLKVNKTYLDILDKKVPLQFISKEQFTIQNISYFSCKFKPVKTKINQNWYDAIPTIINKNIDAELGSKYIYKL